MKAGILVFIGIFLLFFVSLVYASQSVNVNVRVIEDIDETSFTVGEEDSVNLTEGGIEKGLSPLKLNKTNFLIIAVPVVIVVFLIGLVVFRRMKKKR